MACQRAIATSLCREYARKWYNTLGWVENLRRRKGQVCCHGIWCDSRRDLYVVQPGDWGRVRRIVKYTRQ
jgi:hypothetical protein